MAVTPMPTLSASGARAFSYGSLYSSAVTDERQPNAAIRLISGTTGSRFGTSGPRLTLRLQGRTKMDLHGQITCSEGVGLAPGLVVDGTAST